MQEEAALRLLEEERLRFNELSREVVYRNFSIELVVSQQIKSKSETKYSTVSNFHEPADEATRNVSFSKVNDLDAPGNVAHKSRSYFLLVNTGRSVVSWRASCCSSSS
jgi:hypothetical protein